MGKLTILYGKLFSYILFTPAEVTDSADIESVAKVLAEYIING